MILVSSISILIVHEKKKKSINGGLDLGLAQIYPLWDEDTSDERMAVRASFADPYLAILLDDSSLLLLQADDSGDLDEVDIHEPITSTKWLSCCLYNDTSKTFSSSGPTSESPSQGDILLFLLSLDCKLFVSHLNKSLTFIAWGSHTYNALDIPTP